jgi:hypothetical protein
VLNSKIKRKLRDWKIVIAQFAEAQIRAALSGLQAALFVFMHLMCKKQCV